MSAIGLPSYSSAVEMRLMSGIERAVRKASRNLSDSLFRLENSMSLMIKVIQDRAEQRNRPMITVFTGHVALMNIVNAFSAPGPLAAGACWSAAPAEESAGAAAEAEESAGAAEA